MLLVARRNLFSERTRLAITVGGVALAVFLIGILLSLYRGWEQKVGGFVEHVPADLWVASDGTTDFINSASILPKRLGDQLALLPEVETVSPVIVRPMELFQNDDPTDTFDVHLVGYDPSIGIGGPLTIVEGKSPPGPDEVVIDKRTSERFGVEIGDRLSQGSETLTVVGKSSGGDFVFSQTVFVTLDTATEFLNIEPPTARTFFLISFKDSASTDSLAPRLNAALPGVDFISGERFASESRDRILGNILPILVVVLIVAFIVGLAVAGLTIYTSTVEKAREYGILKAEGFTNRFLYRVVFEQSLVTSAIGLLLGVGATIVVAPFAQDLVPQFVVFIRWQDMLAVTGITILIGLIAAFIPVRRLAAIDPVTVFKG